MQISNFAEANAVLESFIPRPYKSAHVYTLDNISRLMQQIGNPQNKLRVIHVAGTSGKTSTAYYAAGLLHAAGHKIGLTVSPHVDEVNERVQINMVPLPEAEFCRELGDFMDLATAAGVTVTYYELLVAFMYWEFLRQGVDYAVVEVGLGGLLDGTNVAGRPDKVCIITDIGLDHTQVLGSTLPEIAAQKAGIIHDGNPVFMYSQSQAVDGVVMRTAEKKQAELHRITAITHNFTGDLPLFQQRNLYLAQQAVNYALKRDGYPALTPEQITLAAHTYIPGRMETIILPSGQQLIMDGAHNGQKMASFVESLRGKHPQASVTAVVAFVRSMGETRWQQGLDCLLPELEGLILTAFQAGQDIPRPSVEPSELQPYIAAHGFTNVQTITDPVAALQELRRHQSDILLVIGSFHLLNTLRPYILKS